MFPDSPQYELKSWDKLLIEVVMPAPGDMHVAYRGKVNFNGGVRYISRGEVSYE